MPTNQALGGLITDLVDLFEAVRLNVQKITHTILGKPGHFTLKAETDYIYKTILP